MRENWTARPRFGLSFVAGCYALAICATAQVPLGGYTVPDIANQFQKLARYGDPIAFDRGVADDATGIPCKHYQAVARLPGPGTPYFYVLRSRNAGGTFCDVDCLLGDNQSGQLLVVKLGSRDTDGERLRSNQFDVNDLFDDTAPPGDDTCIAQFDFDGTNGWPSWCHPGGSQIIDGVLAVPMERPLSDACNMDTGDIVLLDLSDPESPVPGPDVFFGSSATSSKGIGVVGVSRDPGTGKYLFVLTGGEFDSGDYVEFWESAETSLSGPVVTLTQLHTWYSDSDADGGDNLAWGGDTDSFEWQTLNCVRDSNGQLYVVVLDDDNSSAVGTGTARLFRVERVGNSFDLDYLVERRIKMTDPIMGDWDASGAVYVTPTGQLILYATEHISEGPGDSVRMGEYRNYDMRHDNTLPATGGWVSFWDDTENWTVGDPDRCLTLDLLDIELEAWSADIDDHENFGDQTSALRWNLPLSHCVRCYENTNQSGDFIDLGGVGVPRSISSFDDFGISSVRYFLPFELPPGPNLGVFPTPGVDVINEALRQMACTQGGQLLLGAGLYNESVYIGNPMTIRSIGLAIIQPP